MIDILDTPGIDPGTFRLQSGRATTALRAHNMRMDRVAKQLVDWYCSI